MQIKELGHIVLYVTDINLMSDFYKNILGFKQVGKSDKLAAFSSGRTHHELLLIEIGGKPIKDKKLSPGLYHFGLKIGDDDDTFKKAVEDLKNNNVEITGFGDHGVTHSVYIKDPDGNEIELYVDVSDEWKTNPSVVLKPTKPLDL